MKARRVSETGSEVSVSAGLLAARPVGQSDGCCQSALAGLALIDRTIIS